MGKGSAWEGEARAEPLRPDCASLRLGLHVLPPARREAERAAKPSAQSGASGLGAGAAAAGAAAALGPAHLCKTRKHTTV